MTEFEQLTACLPCEPDFCWNWDGLDRSPLAGIFAGMAGIPQHKPWHGEGDVWTHTRMVCTALSALPGFRALSVRRQQILALAALLHDVGKIRCTREENGIISAPHHASAGAQDVRRLLWQDFDLAGKPEAQRFREAVCLLIRYHTAPLHLLDGNNPQRRAREIASNGENAPDFTLDMLCLLAEADVRGRICNDMQELLDSIQLSRELALEAGCLHAPYPFPSAHTRRAYLSGRDVWPEQALYDDCWGEVILMCGLPGTGKDSWIQENHPGMPVVCMDDLRRSMGVKPTDDQGRVVQAAREQARVHLRAKQSFIWNATCVSAMTRDKQIRLFESYGAAVRIIYLETNWQENLHRNANRRYAVPEPAILRMMDNLTPPETAEAHAVEWICR